MGWFFLLLFGLPLFADISALYLSWYADPTTTMTIQWHTEEEELEDVIFIEQQGGWTPIEGSHHPLPYLLVHTVHLENLTPDTETRFRIGNHPEIYTFKTAPASLTHPIRFVIGGDADQSTKLFRKMNQTIAALDPLFCVIGGDIAYALGINPFRLHSSSLKRWLSFLSNWKEQMVTKEGRLIPFLLGAGNHDLASDQYELFFSLFAFPKKQLYRAIDFGSYLSLILLDTNHFQPIEGRQTLWLKNTLSERSTVPYVFPVYHEAAYPSYYPYNGTIPKKIRTHWCPLFEEFGVSYAFENHNHAFKRTYPIKDGKIDATGVTYLGDGCWGATPRPTHENWYLEKRGRKNNIYLIEISQEKAKMEAIDLLGHTLDSIIY